MKISITGINKSFGENQVLFDAGLEVLPGEVHALMGENGAGKSTLMNILTGVHEADTGEIHVNDKKVTFVSPKEAEEQGIAFIHQELNVLRDMTVEENLFLNKEITNSFGILDKKMMRTKTLETLGILDVHIAPDTPMSTLSVGQQQMIEISKALMGNVETIIMDEPTAALTDTESKKLFDVIRSLKAKNVAIIYISHRMEEIFKISDRITVMRDGHYIGTKETKETNEAELIKMMIGRELKELYPARNTTIGEVYLEVNNLGLDERIKDISFQVRSGEVLGFSGLMGSGRSEIMHALFGSTPIAEGEVILDGKHVKIKNPGDAMKQGIGFVTEDRKSEGLLLAKSIRENLSLPNLKDITDNGFINKKNEKSVATSSIGIFRVRTENEETEVRNLSGGNQQKVVIAKWVLTNPKVLILDEPTRGVDVGAKEEIYQIINDLAEKGIAIILVSSDLPEVIGMSDRIAVMHEGKLRGILEKPVISQENIMTLATGGKIIENQ